MDEIVDINFHYGGQWVYNGDVEYANGNVDTIYDFDPHSCPTLILKVDIQIC